MKKFISLLLCVLLLLSVFASLAACDKNDTDPTINDQNNTDQNTPDNTDTTPPDTTPTPQFAKVDPTKLTANKTYNNDHGSLTSAYEGKSLEDYEGVCVYYEENGWELYCENEMNKNLFSTYTNGSKIAHVYWIESLEELNIVTSDSGAENLPPKEAGATGSVKTSVTQLQQKSSETSGMAYIVQLSDGSFIVYDGGYDNTVEQLINTLKELAGGRDVHIRAWLITHSHDDHFSCFKELATNYKRIYKSRINITLDYLLISPMSNAHATSMDADGNFFASEVQTRITAFDGAKICYVHTGMKFNFSNMVMEILYTPDDLFIDGSTGYFNDSSIVSRIYSAQPDSKESMSMIFLGDAGVSVANRLMLYYGSYLKSDMCQISHHGVENFPLLAYQMIKAPILFYPCNTALYNLTNRDAEVRKALREWSVTEEILLRDNAKYKRFFDPSLNTASAGKPQ